MHSIISQDIIYIGVDDHAIDLFESQYPVPDGVSYNSYLIIDDKIAIMDTADRRAADAWFSNLHDALQGRAPDYLVITHMEPDHSACIGKLLSLYPDITVVGNARTLTMLPQFVQTDVSDRSLEVKEGTSLPLGKHMLAFYMAPMVHWPEVMVAYEPTEKLLFSADAFGRFGALDVDMPWTDEARRYYFNIVGKYGAQVTALLKKLGKLDISRILPLHGPVLDENVADRVEQYRVWASYEPETPGVTIAYCSVHGNTEIAALKCAEAFKKAGEAVEVFDLARCDMSRVVASAFRYDLLVLASPTVDGELFPAMEDLLYHLMCKNFQKRTIGIIQNGSWAPSASGNIRVCLESMKDLVVLRETVTIKSTVTPENEAEIAAMAEKMMKRE